MVCSNQQDRYFHDMQEVCVCQCQRWTDESTVLSQSTTTNEKGVTADYKHTRKLQTANAGKRTTKVCSSEKMEYAEPQRYLLR